MTENGYTIEKKIALFKPFYLNSHIMAHSYARQYRKYPEGI